MREIQVLLVGLTGLVADIVREVVSQQDDMEIIDALQSIDDVDSIAEPTQLDLVIAAYPQDETEFRRFDRVLAARSGLRVLAIEGDGRMASMYALLPQLTQLGPLSPATLVEFIRASLRTELAPDR